MSSTSSFGRPTNARTHIHIDYHIHNHINISTNMRACTPCRRVALTKTTGDVLQKVVVDVMMSKVHIVPVVDGDGDASLRI